MSGGSSIKITVSDDVVVDTNTAMDQIYQFTITGEINTYPNSMVQEVFKVVFENVATIPLPCSATKVYPDPIPSPQIYEIGSPQMNILTGNWLETRVNNPLNC